MGVPPLRYLVFAPVSALVEGVRQMDTYNEIQQKIADCRWQLSDSASPIGDWKIAKCYEYALMGLPAPYDMTELNAKRQAVRDEINELEEKLKKFDIPVVRKEREE